MAKRVQPDSAHASRPGAPRPRRRVTRTDSAYEATRLAQRDVTGLSGMGGLGCTKPDRELATWLGSSRLLPPPAQPLDPAEQLKIAQTQADRIVEIIRAVLDGLDLTSEQRERGRDIAVRELRAAATEGWTPL